MQQYHEGNVQRDHKEEQMDCGWDMYPMNKVECTSAPYVMPTDSARVQGEFTLKNQVPRHSRASSQHDHCTR